MPDPKRQVDPRDLAVLVELLKLDAGSSFAKVSSKDLGTTLGLSQQAASLRLIGLQREGMVERAHSGRGLSVRLTDAGRRAVESYYTELKSAIEGHRGDLKFSGTVFTGFREGGYYVSLKGYARPFVEALGFEPFPGTLNLRLTNQAMIEQRRRLDALDGVEVSGFRDGRRTYGPVKCFRATVGDKVPGAVLAIERTHYDSSVLEIISPQNLRRSLRLSDGDPCDVTVSLG